MIYILYRLEDYSAEMHHMVLCGVFTSKEALEKAIEFDKDLYDYKIIEVEPNVLMDKDIWL